MTRNHSPQTCVDGSLGWHNARFYGGGIASDINSCDVAVRELHHLHSGTPIIVCSYASQGLGIWEDACPVLDDRHSGSQVPCNWMADEVQPIAKGLGHWESLQEHRSSNTTTEAGIRQKLSFCSFGEHRVQRAFQDATRQCRFSPNLEKDQQSASAILLCTSFGFLRRNSHRQIRSSIGRSAQPYGYAPEAVCLTAKPKRSNAEKYRRKDRECSDDNCPSVPPHYTAIDPQARARAKPIPPAHSLIPLWIRPHSATPPLHRGLAHG